MKVLVIEDDDAIRQIVQIALVKIAGWEVATASSGPEGVARATAERPDVVLLDVMMPDMDGPSTLRALSRSPSARDVPVIFLTARVQQAERRQLIEMGARGVIAKPFDPLQLAAQIGAILREA